MVPRRIWIVVAVILILLAFCIYIAKHHQGAFQASVDSKLEPKQLNVSARDLPQTVSASRDDKGIQTDFLEGIALLKTKSDADLQSFLARYHGTVVGDDTIPEPPAQLGLHLTQEERKPTH